MHKLTFKNDKANTLAQMLKWANGHPRRIPYATTITNSQGLWLIKDEGIYLMSPTDENFVDKLGVANTVVYARGYKPTKTNRDTLWDKTYDVSSDDFTKFVTLTADQVARVLDGGGITIKLNATTLEITA